MESRFFIRILVADGASANDLLKKFEARLDFLFRVWSLEPGGCFQLYLLPISQVATLTSNALAKRSVRVIHSGVTIRLSKTRFWS